MGSSVACSVQNEPLSILPYFQVEKGGDDDLATWGGSSICEAEAAFPETLVVNSGDKCLSTPFVLLGDHMDQ
jgi:hypothetical protein